MRRPDRLHPRERAVGAGARRRGADLLPALVPRARPDHRRAGRRSGRPARAHVPRHARRPGRPRHHDEPLGGLRRPDDALAGELPAAARLRPRRRRRRPLADVVRAETEAHGARACDRRDDPPRQERPSEGRAERAGRAELPGRREAARVLVRDRLPAEPTARAERARLRARAGAERGRARPRHRPLGDHAAAGRPRRAADPRDLRARTQARASRLPCSCSACCCCRCS